MNLELYEEIKNYRSLLRCYITKEDLNKDINTLAIEVRERKRLNNSLAALTYKTIHIFNNLFNKYYNIEATELISLFNETLYSCAVNFNEKLSKFTTILYKYLQRRLNGAFLRNQLKLSKYKFIILEDYELSYSIKENIRLNLECNNLLNNNEKEVIMMVLNSYTEKEIKNKLKFSLGKIQRIKKNVKKKIKISDLI